MASRIIQITELPNNYTLCMFDANHSGAHGMFVDVELADPHWTAFTGRLLLPHGIAPASKQAAAALLKLLFKGLERPTNRYGLTEDQQDFLRSLEAIRLKEWVTANE